MRNGEWRKIPNNTLAEGDIIRLLPNEIAPALVEFLPEHSANAAFTGLGVSTLNLNTKGNIFLNKGSTLMTHEYNLKRTAFTPSSENIDINEAL